MIPEEAQ